MRIYYSSKKFRRQCLEEKEGNKTWGIAVAAKVRLRLKELEAARTLADISKLPPPRCHPLKGDRLGQFAVCVTGQVRLIFKPDGELQQSDAQNGLSEIQEIIVLEVTDYHE